MKLKPLNKIIDRLNEAIIEARNIDYRESDYLSATIKEGNIRIRAYLDDSDVVEAEVIGKKGREYPNIEEYITERLLHWYDIAVEDEISEWNLNGFREEDDYNRFKY